MHSSHDINPDAPPEFGEIEFRLATAPVSQQASRAAKEGIRNQVRALTAPLRYLIDSEVQIDIEWFIHERLRWETDTSPDVDNIIKPLLDGLCGPKGVLIDDCQVRSTSSSWINWVREDQEVLIRIKFDPDRYLMKEGLSFVRIEGALCFPVPLEVQKRALSVWLDAIESALLTRKRLEEITDNYYPARYVLPHGSIHRTRISNFLVYDLTEMREWCNNQNA